MSFENTLIHPSGRSLVLDPTRVVLAFDPGGRPKNLVQALASAGLVPEDSAPGASKRLVNQSPRYFFARSANGERLDATVAKKLLELLGKKTAKPRLLWVGGVYRFAGSDRDRDLMAPVQDALIVRLQDPKSAKAQKALLALVKRLGLVVDAKRSKQVEGGLFVRPGDVNKRPATAAVAQLLEAGPKLVAQAQPDYVPLISPASATPSSETHWAIQWNMTQIGAEAAWDSGTGDPSVFVCVIDSGIERGHEELNRATNRGHNVDSGLETVGLVPGVGDVTAPAFPTALGAGHGTAMASIASATWDAGGVAGLAGGASLLAISAPNWAAFEVGAAIDRARDLAAPPTGGVGKRVILLGGVSATWAGTGVETALNAALAAGLIVVCPSGNTNALGVDYPGDGTHPELMVCGASDQADERYTSSYGPTIAVVAPGKDVPVADLVGANGYSTDSYHLVFEGSSCGAAHTAGALALLLSASGLDFASYPGAGLREKLRSVIERTSEKVGSVAYTTEINPRNDEMGFGRIRADYAVSFADVMIKDDPVDTGVEPSTGVFWRDSDIVARKDPETQAVVEANFDVWQPDAAQARNIYVKPDLSDSYVYVRVGNLGPAAATNVRVRCVGAACSTGFQYPTDWNAGEDATHLVMTPSPWTGDPGAVGDEYVVGNLAQGVTKIVRFTVSHAQALKARDTWSGHACALARVTADNDHAFNLFSPAAPTGGEQSRRNNLVQRNLHSVTATSPWFFPFLAGGTENPDDEFELIIDTSRVPSGTLVRLHLDDAKRAFPDISVDELSAKRHTSASAHISRGPNFTLLDRARVQLSCGGAEGVLTLQPGTRFECLANRTDVATTGAQVTVANGKRVVESRARRTSVRLQKRPHELLPLLLEIPLPAGTQPSDRYLVDVSQRDRSGRIVGGFSLVLLR